MGSGILLAVLVVLWFVVLVPMVLNRGSSAPEAVTSERTGSEMRVLRRRGSGSKAAAGLAGGALARLRRPLRDPRVEADVVARRRRTLVGLVLLAVVWLLLAVFYRSYFWTAQIVLDLMVFGYLVYLRLEAQREAERRVRRAVRFPERRLPAGRAPTFSNVDVTAPIPKAPTPTGGWTPNPVPVPTYVNKAMAPARQRSLDEQLVRIDDDDPNFADLGEWRGNRAVGD